jgi:hypothetical protein
VHLLRRRPTPQASGQSSATRPPCSAELVDASGPRNIDFPWPEYLNARFSNPKNLARGWIESTCSLIGDTMLMLYLLVVVLLLLGSRNVTASAAANIDQAR